MDLSAILNDDGLPKPHDATTTTTTTTASRNGRRPDHYSDDDKPGSGHQGRDATRPALSNGAASTSQMAESVYAEMATPYDSTRLRKDDAVGPAKESDDATVANIPAVVVEEAADNDKVHETVDVVPKPEPGSAVDSTPATTEQPDTATLLAINDAQNQFGTRIRKSSGAATEKSASPKPEAKADMKPGSKKRPKSATPRTSAGNAKRPAKKKRRLDSPANSQRSCTPQHGSKSSRATTARATPLETSSEGEEDEAESDPEDTNIYCICRKPDNHTWMIGCDGGCEDWFHGKCVGMVQADEGLLDRFICPNCQAKGSAVTTWKPMCRRDGCRQPARLKKGAESKYCSDECGRRFMQAMVARSGRNKGVSPKKTRRGAAAHKDESEAGQVDLGPFGGALRAHELSALTLSTPTLEDFKSLGNVSNADALPTPPASSVSPSDERKNPMDADANYTHDEGARLAAISERKGQLREQRALLKDREKFVGFIRAYASNKLEKQQCGFDPRLSWDETTFAHWRQSLPGQSVFERGSLDVAEADGECAVCLRKRCQRHGTWQKLAVQDVRFEEADVGDEMRRIDAEERDIRQRAALRRKKAESRIPTQQGEGGTTQDGRVEAL